MESETVAATATKIETEAEAGARPATRELPRVVGRGDRKAATFHRIQEAAMRLFLANGYEATTVQEIAAAAGVSHMTVFRHFPTKETLVLRDEYDPLMLEIVRGRPATEHPLDSVGIAVGEVMGNLGPGEIAIFLQRLRLVNATPALQAWLWTNWMESQGLVAAALAERGGVPTDPLALRVVSGIACVTALTAALAWSEEEGRRPIAAVLAEAFAAARRHSA